MYVCVCVCIYLFLHVFIDFAFVFCLSNADMDNNDVICYLRTLRNIVGAISFLSYFRNKFDRKHGFHPAFVDDHIRELDQTNIHVKYLLHVHQRESGRRTRRDWLESIKYCDHYLVDLNSCYFFHQSGCVLEDATP